MKLKPVVMMSPSPGLWLMDGNDAKFIISIAPAGAAGVVRDYNPLVVKKQAEVIALTIAENLPDEIEV